MPEILQQHLELLVAKYDIRKDEDFLNVKEVYSASFYEGVQDVVRKLPSVRDVEVGVHKHSMVECVIHVFFRWRSIWGVVLEFSTIAPFYRFRYVTPRNKVRIDQALIDGMGRKRLSAWLRKEPCIPPWVVKQARVVLREFPVFGLVCVSDAVLSAMPQPSSNLPKHLCKHAFGFYFFDSVSLWGGKGSGSRKS